MESREETEPLEESSSSKSEGRAPLTGLGKILKFIFIFINLLYIIGGLAFMGLGIYVSVEQRRLPDFAGTQLLACGIVMIIIGLITFMITLIGAIAGFTHNKRLLVVYGVLVCFALLLGIVMLVVGSVYRNEIVNVVAGSYVRLLVTEYRPKGVKDFNADVNYDIDELHKDLHCCGWTGSDEWKNTTYYKDTKMYPKSCECPNGTTKACTTKSNGQVIYNNTCKAGVINLVEKNMDLIIGISVLVVVVQIAPLVLSIALICAISKAEQSTYVVV